MSKGKRVLTLTAVLLLAGLFLHSYIQHQREAERRNQRQTAEDIGLYILEGASSGQFQVGEDICLSQLDPSEAVVQSALAQPSFHSIRLIEKDVVLIMGDALFQSVSGYLVTTGERELPAQYETGLKSLDAGGRVHTGKITEHLYGWTGGL